MGYGTSHSRSAMGTKGRLTMTDHVRYRARHQGLLLGLGVGGALWHRVLAGAKPPTPRAFLALRRALGALLAADMENADAGLYPKTLLHQMPWRAYVSQLPLGMLEFARIYRRRRFNGFRDLPPDIDLQRFPSYYRRTFHWQTDGWLSDRSAELYDVGVEFLFGGVANVMRRMGLPPLVKAVQGQRAPRILDLACGTGRFLSQAAAAIPHGHFTGLDLSPHYLRYAMNRYGGTAPVRWVQGLGEAQPFDGGQFDAVSCVFMFHELPRDIRRAVVAEMWRVLAPGGTVVMVDAAQLSNAPDLGPFLENFPRVYHEPYFKSYLRDDLVALLGEEGFEITDHSDAFLARVVAARRPAAAQRST